MRHHHSALTSALASLVLAGGLMLPAPGAEGQVVPSPYAFINTNQELGLFAAHLDSDRGRFSIGPGPTTLYGVRYSIKLGASPLAFEAVTFGGPFRRHVVDPERSPEERIVDETRGFMAGGDVRLRMSLPGPRTWHGLNPYGAVGAGVAADLAHTGADDLPIDAESEFRFGPAFMGVAAAGVRWLPFDRIGVRGEASAHFWRLGTPRAFSQLQDELGSIPEREWATNPMITLAVTYRF